MAEKTESNETQQPAQTSTTTVMPCPYHDQIVAMSSSGQNQDLKPMERFLAEGPGEQSALFIRADTGKPSTNKECTCANNTTQVNTQGEGS